MESSERHKQALWTSFYLVIKPKAVITTPSFSYLASKWENKVSNRNYLDKDKPTKNTTSNTGKNKHEYKENKNKSIFLGESQIQKAMHGKCKVEPQSCLLFVNPFQDCCVQSHQPHCMPQSSWQSAFEKHLISKFNFNLQT